MQSKKTYIDVLDLDVFGQVCVDCCGAPDGEIEMPNCNVACPGGKLYQRGVQYGDR